MVLMFAWRSEERMALGVAVKLMLTTVLPSSMQAMLSNTDAALLGSNMPIFCSGLSRAT